MRDKKQLRHIIELARREINQQKAPIALRHLGEIRREVEDCAFPLLSAEYQLAFAEGLGATKDCGAQSEFEDALRRVLDLPERDPMLEMRAFEHFARCLCSQGRLSRAFENYTSAKKLAVELKLFEDSARIQLLLTFLKYKIDNDSQLPDFQNFGAAAGDSDYTAQEQLATWAQYTGNSREEGLQAARKHGSIEYFKRLLKSVREEQRDEIPG